MPVRLACCVRTAIPVQVISFKSYSSTLYTSVSVAYYYTTAYNCTVRVIL